MRRQQLHIEEEDKDKIETDNKVVVIDKVVTEEVVDINIYDLLLLLAITQNNIIYYINVSIKL